jgi:hypothetical protein
LISDYLAACIPTSFQIKDKPIMRSINYLDKEQGQALVEFALMLPILVFLLMAIMDFSRIMLVYAQMSNSAREAARFGSVIGNDPDDPRYFHCEDIRAVAEEALLFSMEFDEFRIEYDAGNDPVLFTCESAGDLQDGYRIRVTFSTSIDFLTPGMSSVFLFPDGLSMQFSSARTIWLDGIVVGNPSL